MRTIIRCPGCFTYVYSDARRCHGCGERVGKRKLLTRGSWIFIVLVVAGFTFGRGIELHQEKNQKVHRQFEIARETEISRQFIRTWLVGSDEEIQTKFSERKTFAGDLLKLRGKYPEILPATDVPGRIRMNEPGWQAHLQSANGPLSHAQEEWPSKLRASSVPPGTRLREIRARFTQRSWGTNAYEFEAEFMKDNQSYTIYGQVCIEDGNICCLAIDRIESIEGRVAPKE